MEVCQYALRESERATECVREREGERESALTLGKKTAGYATVKAFFPSFVLHDTQN